MGSGEAGSFLRKNHIFRHSFMDSGMGRSKLGSTPCPDMTWMSTPPKTAASVSELYGSRTQKKCIHRSKWGLIPMKASHRVTKVMICKIPKGVRLCSSRPQYYNNEWRNWCDGTLDPRS
jgi:hypothetical protein